MVNLSDELSCQELSHFLANCLSLLYGGPSKMLFDKFCLWIDSQTVLSQSPGYTRHVRRFPCKDVPVLTEELDERFFLFGVECCGDMSRSSVGVGRVDVNWFCLTGRLER